MVVCVLTGHGLKDPEARRSPTRTPCAACRADLEAVEEAVFA